MISRDTTFACIHKLQREIYRCETLCAWSARLTPFVARAQNSFRRDGPIVSTDDKTAVADLHGAWTPIEVHAKPATSLPVSARDLAHNPAKTTCDASLEGATSFSTHGSLEDVIGLLIETDTPPLLSYLCQLGVKIVCPVVAASGSLALMMEVSLVISKACSS